MNDNKQHHKASCTYTQAHLAHIDGNSAEIRVRGTPRKPQVSTTTPAQHSTPKVVVQRAARGCWRIMLTGLAPGTEYFVSLNGEESKLIVTVRTIETRGLGRRRLRIGMLADSHVNLCSYNGKRLHGSANELLTKHSKKLVNEHKVDCLALPGDVCDTGSHEELSIARDILSAISVPVYAVIGNHEVDFSAFNKALVPQSDKGYYSVDTNGIHLILLATDSQSSLDNGTEQLKWLRHDLANQNCDIVIVFMHFSLVLHPLHNDGQWDDGLQVLDNAKEIIALLHSYPAVRAVLCGHKNVPSAVVDTHGLLHTLSPQLIQVPCGYDVFDIYDHGLTRCFYEIDETELQDVSLRAAGETDARHRWGKQEHRSFRFDWK